MFNPTFYENSRTQGIGVLQIRDAEDGEETVPRFVPLKGSELRGEIGGPLASLRLTQVYGYSREQLDKTVEAVYRFPLPGDAAVTGVTVRFGDVEIEAVLKERGEAEKEYQEAVDEGRQSALLQRESPDVFSLLVAGIEPEQSVSVETRYVQLARPQGGDWTLRVPLTTAPRYVRTDELSSRHAHGQPLYLVRDPGHRFNLDLLIHGAVRMGSTTHELALERQSDGTHIRLQEGDVMPDRDLVLSWQLDEREERPSLQVMLHRDEEAGQVYFMALVAPPATHEGGTGVPREITLLVDHSGSMRGPKWEAADWAVERFLHDLYAHDRFNLCLFHTRTRWFAQHMQPADEGTVERAVSFLRDNTESGGTNLGVALEQGLDMPRASGDTAGHAQVAGHEYMARHQQVAGHEYMARHQQVARHLVIVTDAQVTDAGRILRLAEQEFQRDDRRRISVLCIDAAPNAFLANQLAERGGGTAHFLTSSPEEEDITTALDDVLADWGEPVVSDLRLEINRDSVEAGQRRVLETGQSAHGRIDLGDLPAGRAIWVSGRAPAGEDGLALRLLGGGGELAEWRADRATEGSNAGIKALFGARRVLGLEHLIHGGYSGDELREQLRRLGYDPQQAMGRSRGRRKLYAENARRDAEGALRELLVREALDYGLVSAETAFVAVRREVGQKVETTVPVGNALPSGWSDRFLTKNPRLSSAGFGTPAPPVGGQSQPRMRSLGLASFSQMAAPDASLLQRVRRPSGGGQRAYSGGRGPSDGRELRQVFDGRPRFAKGQAVLFDSSRPQDRGAVPETVTIRRLVLRFPDGEPQTRDLGRELTLLLYAGDLSQPRARVRMADLIRHNGERPLNLALTSGDTLRIVLSDPEGVWRRAPHLELHLAW